MPVLLLSAFLFAADPAAATAGATQSTAAPQQEAVKTERKICKREHVSTSLHGSKRICLTAREWRIRNGEASVEDLGSAVGSRAN